MTVQGNPILTRRSMLKLAGGAVLAAALSACGKKSGSGKEQTLVLMTAMGEPKDRGIAHLVAEFEQSHPHIHIEHNPVPWDQSHSKLLTMIAGGSPPDLLTVTGTWMAEFRAMGALENLKPWYQGWEHKDAFTPVAIQSGKIATAIEGENVYGLPIEASIRCMYYRRDWFNELGLKPAETREEWRRLCEKMTDPRKKRYGYAFRGARGGYASWWQIAEEFAGTNEWFDQDNRCIINSPDHVKGLEFWNALYQDRLAPEDSLNWGYTELVQAFWSGVCGCCEQDVEVIGTCLEHGMNETTLLTAPMPAGPKARVGGVGVWFMSMASGSKRKEAAWEVLSWLQAPDQIVRYCKEVGMIPPVKKGLEDPSFGQGLYKPFMDMANDSTLLLDWNPSYLPEMAEFFEVRTMEEQQKMLLKRQTAQETLDHLADFMTQAQKRYIDKHGPDTPRPPKRA